VSGVIWGMVIFDETHSLWIWASVVLLMTGLVLVTPRKEEKSHVS
jgi:drug/metabolite transporter (DMT)-like permease